MNVNSTGSTGAVTSPAMSLPTRAPRQELGQEDFLQLLTVQLQKQDPLKPMEDTAFIAQMAQFSALTQASQLVLEMGYLRADTQLQAASGLIGRQVTLQTDAGSVTGVVDSVEADATSVYVRIGEQAYPFSAITRVEPAPAPVPPDETPVTS